MEINQPAPNFELPDLTDTVHNLRDYRGRIVIVNFWSAECPHSERTDREMVAWMNVWAPAVVLLSIASNRNEGMDELRQAADRRGVPVILLDRDQMVADLYVALTTPHVYVLDGKGILRYRGAVDDVTFGQPTVKRIYITEVVEVVLSGRTPRLTETPAFGCTIVREK